MQSTKQKDQSKNLWNMGRYFMKKQKIYDKDLKSEQKEPAEIMQEYMKWGKEKGIQLYKLSLAEFTTQNGYKYWGFIADEDIKPNDILLKIPISTVLTTKKAFFSDIKDVFTENQQLFISRNDFLVEDLVITVFLLRQLNRGQDSEWYYLIQNLPREIDFIIHWTDEELDLLKDEKLQKKAQYQRIYCGRLLEKVKNVLAQYPEKFAPETVTIENIKWIYTHLMTRSFGCHLEYVTMVPIAQMFNHENTGVYFDIVRSKDPEKSLRYLTDEELEFSDSSQGSCDSQDEKEDWEWEIDEISDFEKQKREIMMADLSMDLKKYSNKVSNGLLNNLDLGDSFSIFFFGKIMERVNNIEREYSAGKKKKDQAITEIERLEKLVDFYSFLIQDHYQRFKAQPKIEDAQLDAFKPYQQKQKEAETEEAKKDLAEKRENEKIEQEGDHFHGEVEFILEEDKWPNDDFDYFIMRCGEQDKFEKGAQVYFCYTRLSNKLMLQRYGMTLEYNRYDRYYLRILFSDLLLQYANEGYRYLKYFELTKVKRFTLKNLQFNYDFLCFARSVFWDISKQSVESIFHPLSVQLERAAIDLCINFLEKDFAQYEQSEEDEEKQLLLKELSAHQHFACIYRLEQIRILKLHLKWFRLCLAFVERKAAGEKDIFAPVEDIEKDKQEFLRNRNILDHYTSNFFKQV